MVKLPDGFIQANIKLVFGFLKTSIKSVLQNTVKVNSPSLSQ